MSKSSRRPARLMLALAVLVASTAAAAGPRTFVASFGSDANPCTFPQPCRSFAAAAVQTTDAGEIVVLDSAGYGPVTLTKSVTIVAPAGVYAGVTAVPPDPTVGVTVDGAGIQVALRGLTIITYGAGVLFSHGASVSVERCEITAGAVVGNTTYVGAGIGADSVPPTLGVPPTLFVRDTNITTTGRGIFVKGDINAVVDGLRVEGSGMRGIDVLEGARLSLAHAHIGGMAQAVWLESHLPLPVTSAEIVAMTTAGGGEGARVTSFAGGILALTLRDSFLSGSVTGDAGTGRIDISLSNTRLRTPFFTALEGAAGTGGTLNMEIDGTEISGGSGSVRLAPSSAGTVRLSMVRSKIVNNQYGIQISADVGGSSIAAAVISDTLIADNVNYGVACGGGGASVILSNDTITRNGSGVSLVGCAAKSRKNNTIDGNAGGDLFGSLTDLLPL